MQYKLQRLGGLTLATFILGGCAATPFNGGGQSNVSSSELLEKASQQSGAEATQSRLQAAQALTREGNLQRANDVLNQIDGRQLNAQDKATFAVLKAESRYSAGDPKGALNIARGALGQLQLSSDQKARLEAVEGQSLGRANQHLESATALINAQRDSNNDKSLNNAIWRELSQLTSQQISRLPDPDSLADGWLTLTQLYQQSAGHPTAFKQQLDSWQSSYPHHPASQQLPEQLRNVQNLNVQTINRIAVLLPQSGPYQAVAQAIQQGMQAQAHQMTQSGQSAPSLDFIDSSNGNLDQLYQQAQAAGAQVVIGPIAKDQVTQLEQRQSLPLPTLALNYGNSEHNSASNLFEYGLSAEDEARQAADQANHDGHHNANVLVPDNGWGNRVLNAFSQEWQARGNQLANVQHYNPQASVSSTISRMLRGGNGDMLFMLGLPPYARQVPPTLKYYNSRLPVYATSNVYAGSPDASSDSDLNGVKFPTLPWQLPTLMNGNLPFAGAYHELHDNQQLPPSQLKLAAMGVDAYELAQQLSVYEKIPNTQLQGATGTLKANDDRRIVRQLPWAVFQGGLPAASP